MTELQERTLLVVSHNELRVKKGLKPLTYSDLLAIAADAWANWMARWGRLNHDNFARRISSTGYQYSYAGENIAMGYATVQAVMAGWQKSPGHLANILNPRFTEFGVGIQKDSHGRKWWCVDFGTPLGTVRTYKSEPTEFLPGGISEESG